VVVFVLPAIFKVESHGRNKEFTSAFHVSDNATTPSAVSLATTSILSVSQLIFLQLLVTIFVNRQ
jgi:hypothetical protein